MAKSLQHQIVSRALQLVSDNRTWTQNAIARTATDDPCSFMHPKAVKFCAIGALHRAVFELTGALDFKLAHAAVREVSNYLELPYINDVRGREAVVQLFSKALGSCG
jgi:hypothetical protein